MNKIISFRSAAAPQRLQSGINARTAAITTQASMMSYFQSFDMASQTLPLDGIYTIKINPHDGRVYGINVNVTSP